MKQFSDAAIRLLNRITDLDAGNLKALKCLREVYLESQRWEEALRTQKTVLKYTKGKQAEEEETFFYLGLKYEHVRELLSRGGGDSLDPLSKRQKRSFEKKRSFFPAISCWAISTNAWGNGKRLETSGEKGSGDSSRSSSLSA